MASTGTIVQVIGSTFDALFPEDDLPDIYNAVKTEIEVRGEKLTLVGEVAKHLGGGTVRCVALASTDEGRQWRSLEQVQARISALPPGPQRTALAQRADKAGIDNKTLTPSRPGADWADVWLEGQQ